MLNTRTDSGWLFVAALGVIWVALVLLVDPRGDFPMLDDWSYGRSVKHLVEEGVLRYDGWNAPTLFLQVLYGAAFAMTLGFSFEVLRFATLVAGLSGVIGTYRLLREAQASRTVAMTGSLVLMLNPSYFQHAFTFMTDVPFTALVAWSSLFFLRAMRTGSAGNIALGTALAACATLVRQPGVMIPVAFGIATLATGPLNARTLLRATLPVLAVAATYLVYVSALRYLGMEPALLSASHGKIYRFFDHRELVPGILWLLNRGRVLFGELSLMVLPLVLLLLGFAVRRRWRAPRLLLILSVATVLALILSAGAGSVDAPYPVFSPMPLVMVGQAEWGAADAHYRFRPALHWVQLAAIALMVCLLVAMALHEDDGRVIGRASCFDRAGTIFGFSAAALLVAPFLFSHLYERYMVPALPVLMTALVCLTRPSDSGVALARQKVILSASALALLALGTLAVLFAHDSLLWNRVRWQAVYALVDEKQIEPVAIDGGLSVSGWYLFPLEGPLRRRYSNSPTERGHWWRNDDAEYIVAIMTDRRLRRLVSAARRSTNDDLEIVWRRPYDGWLPESAGEVIVCRGRLCNDVFKKK